MSEKFKCPFIIRMYLYLELQSPTLWESENLTIAFYFIIRKG